MPFPPPKPDSADVAVVGLAVMGQNLALNIADHGFATAVYNRTTSVTDGFIAQNPPAVFAGTGGSLLPAAELADLVAALRRPRRLVLLIKAGRPTDSVINSLTPLLAPGDCIIDGGNALYTDTQRREKAASEQGLLFVGSGVSGGEEGARFGPSLMPGGKREAWELIRPIWEAIAAKVDPKTGKPLEGAAPGKPVIGGIPCAAYIGPDGAGHYVKMVHNGIEYADMQVICEAYHFMRELLGMTAPEMADVFAEWNAGDLDSFLIEITTDILRQKDPVTGAPFVDVVLDAAAQKGTGAWTGMNALEIGSPAATIAEAVFARSLSAQKQERVAASKVLKGPEIAARPGDRREWLASLRDALYCSKICAYAQGFALMAEASRMHNWNLHFGSIAQIWRGGCIIRARFLQKITDAFDRNHALPNLLLDEYFQAAVARGQSNWRKIVSTAATAGLPIPAFASSLAYYDGYRTANLPANLLQAQRDYFGAHTYERTDQPRGKHFHIDWPDKNRPQVEITD